MKANLVFVEPELLDKVEKRIKSILSEIRCTGLMLIDRSGLVIAGGGQMPLHPDQMGAMAASVYSAMSAMIKASRTEEFSIHVPGNNLKFIFRHVDQRLFLCAFCNEMANETLIRTGLEELAHNARNALNEQDTSSRKMEAVGFIEEKLNELFDK